MVGDRPIHASAQQESDEVNWTEEQLSFFESEVLPLLQEKCFACHSHATELSGNLALDFASGLRMGGDRGPAIQAGKPDESLLIRVVEGKEDGLKMPPEETLSAEQIGVLRKWIEQGSPDPRRSPPQPTENDPWLSLLC